MRGVRQAVTLLQLRGVHPVRAFAGDVTSTEGLVLSSGEIGIASGAPTEIYARKVTSDFLQKPCFLWDNITSRHFLNQACSTHSWRNFASHPYQCFELKGRRVLKAFVCVQVLIYSPARTAGQQGKANILGAASNGPGWKLMFETQQK